MKWDTPAQHKANEVISSGDRIGVSLSRTHIRRFIYIPLLVRICMIDGRATWLIRGIIVAQLHPMEMKERMRAPDQNVLISLALPLSPAVAEEAN